MGESIKENKKNKSNSVLAPIDIKGSYFVNGLKFSHSKYEVLLEFFQNPPKENGRTDGIRIYMTPVVFKIVMELLNSQLKIFEDKYGKIER